MSVLVLARSACGGHEPSRAAAPDVPSDAGYDTPTAGPTSTTTPECSPSPAELVAYVRDVAPVVLRLDRIGSHVNDLRGRDSASFAAQIAAMRTDLPALRSVLAQLERLFVRDPDLLALHDVLLTAVRDEVSSYRLWVRAVRLEAYSVRARAEDRMAAAQESRSEYEAAMAELTGLSGNA